jgi:glycosyltransferase involved in cell wall biosynthesis
MLKSDEASLPLVSAVIPTRNRPELVCRAVQSALSQTYSNLEVVVVVDGPDPSTVKALEQLNAPRLRVVALKDNVGGSEARNIGAREAKGEWIALLDDDDEWLPEKLHKQIAVANTLKDKVAFLACKFVERSANETRIYPSRMPDRNEPIEEYLFCPKGYPGGAPFVQTSTLLIPRELMMRIPFVTGLKRGQELVWMFRACTYGYAGYHIIPEVLSIFNAEGYTDNWRVSSKPNWRSYYEWVQENRMCFSPKAYSFCIATSVLPDVMRCKEPLSVKIKLLRDCIRDGSPTPKCLMLVLLRLCVPIQLLRRLKNSLSVATKQHRR